MFTDKTKELTLIVADNGVGFPENIDFKNTVSLGLHIVVTLVKQLKGKIDLNRQCGALFKITFKRGRDAEYKES
jgi:two-component sensor histidine kinase